MAPVHVQQPRPKPPRQGRTFGRTQFKARLSPPAPIKIDEMLIDEHFRLKEKKAIEQLRLKEKEIKEQFQLEKEEAIKRFWREWEPEQVIDLISDGLAHMDIDRPEAEAKGFLSSPRKEIFPRGMEPKKLGAVKDANTADLKPQAEYGLLKPMISKAVTERHFFPQHLFISSSGN